MPRPPDIGWQYGTMIGGHRHHVQCNYCHRIMIGGITRFKKHLASKKGEIKGCEAVPKEVKEIIKKHLASAKPRRPNRKKHKAADGTVVVPQSSNYNMESDASEPDTINARQELLDFGEAENHAPQSAEQQFEFGTREFFDAFAGIQGKDEQDFGSTRGTDLGWAHGVMVNGDRQKIECKYCHKVILGGGISRLKQHLAGERGNIAPCEKVPDDVKLQMQQLLKASERLKKQDSEVEHSSILQDIEDYGGDVPNITSPRDGSRKRRAKEVEEGNSVRRKKTESMYTPQSLAIPQLTLHVPCGSQENIDEANIAVAKFMYEAGVPFDAANSLYFQRMAEAIAAVGPGYRMPSYHSLRNEFLRSCANEVRDFGKELRKSWELTGCTVMLDRWMDKTGRSIINFYVYCPKGTMFLKSVDVTDTETTLDGLVSLLESIVQDVGPRNIIQFLADSNPWYKAAGEELTKRYKTFFWSVCVNHCIELMLKRLTEMDEVNGVMSKAKKICQFLHNHAWVLDLLKNKTEGREIIQLASTQSVTDFLTLQNVFSLCGSLQQMLTCSQWEQSELSKQKMGIDVKDIVLDMQFWQLCEKIIRVSRPLTTVLYLVDSGERPSMGYIYDAIEKAKKDIVSAFEDQDSDYAPYLNVINDARAEFHSPLHAAAYYLNPSIYYNPRFAISNVIQKGILDCIETIEPDATAQDNITKHKVFYEDALGDFSRPMALRGRDSLAPATWWSMYASDYPDLQRFAVRILSQTCSMIVSERSCNSIENIHSSKNTLENERLSDLALVHYNLRVRQRQTMAGENKPIPRGEYDPISIDNYTAGDWIRDPREVEGEVINLPNVAILAAEKICNSSDDNLDDEDDDDDDCTNVDNKINDNVFF